mgnify:CR=1 FL=1
MKILDNTRRKVFLSMNIIFIILLSGYGIYNSIIKNRVIGIFETSVSLMLIITTYLFVKKISIFFPVVISMALFYIMAVYLFISGGAQGTGIFWLFVIPAVFFFFLGLKYGTALFLIQYLSIIVIFFISKTGHIEIYYDDKTVLFFLIVSFFESIILFIHEKILNNYISQIKVMRGLLPICANCKKIRDDKGYWKQVEVYIQEHSEADFTHSICPDCAKKLYPDIFDKNNE